MKPRTTIRDAETQVAMRLMDSRRQLITSLGEETYRARVDECRTAILAHSLRTGEADHREAALELAERAEKRMPGAQGRVIGTLLLIVAALEMSGPPAVERAERLLP